MGGGAVAIWSRASDPQEWKAAVSAAEALLHAGARTRATGVYLFGSDASAHLERKANRRRLPAVAMDSTPSAEGVSPWPVQ